MIFIKNKIENLDVKWYLPSIRDLQIMLQNKKKLDLSLAICEEDTIEVIGRQCLQLADENVNTGYLGGELGM